MQQEEMDPVMEVALWQHRQQVRGRIEARFTNVLNKAKRKQKKKEKKQIHVEKPAHCINLLSDSESSDDSAATYDYSDSDNEMLADKMARWAAEKVPQQSVTPSCPSKKQKYPVVPMTIKKLWQEIEALPPAALEAPCCSCKTCPFAATSNHVPIMLQRRNLLKRLLMLERALFGI